MRGTNQQAQWHKNTQTRLTQKLKSTTKFLCVLRRKEDVKHNGYCRVFVHWLAELRVQYTLPCTRLYICVLATLMYFCSVFDFLFELAGCWRRMCLWLFDMHSLAAHAHCHTVKRVYFWELHLWQCLAVYCQVTLTYNSYVLMTDRESLKRKQSWNTPWYLQDL